MLSFALRCVSSCVVYKATLRLTYNVSTFYTSTNSQCADQKQRIFKYLYFHDAAKCYAVCTSAINNLFLGGGGEFKTRNYVSVCMARNNVNFV